MTQDERRAAIAELRRRRPRSRLLRSSAFALGALVAFAWLAGDLSPAELLTERRLANLERFLREDAFPYPLRETGFEWSGLVNWAGEVVADRGLAGALATLWISVLAIVLAASLALLLAPLGAHTLMTRDPFAIGASRSAARSRAPWRAIVSGSRLVAVLLRAIPEYVWAFLLLAMLGTSAWPAVLALAIHNSGILARLGSETLENLDAAPLRALAMAGANRRELAFLAALPLALPRFLLYFFYRFESCIREATVLGMLGTVSLGYWIQDSRGRQRYDEMLLLVALGAVLVVACDLASFAARRWVRHP